MIARINDRPFAHVLCWVDGSEASCRAAERAARLARALHAELSFLALGTQHARDEGFEAYARLEGVSGPMPPTLPGRASACLDKALSTAAGLGMPNAARTQGADLVVVGRRKPGLLGRLLGIADAETSTRGCGFSVLSVG
jgi:hypothetical protein